MSTEQFPKKLLVEDCGFKDVTTVGISSQLAEELSNIEHNALRVFKKDFSIYTLPIEDESLENSTISLPQLGRINIHCGLGEYARVEPVMLKSLSKVEVSPIAGQNITGDLFTNFIKPFFLDAYRPVSKGLSFSVVSGIVEVNFKIVGVEVASTHPNTNSQEPTEEQQTTNTSHGVNCGILTNDTQIVLMPEIESDENYDYIGYSDIGGHTKSIKNIRESIELPLRHPELFVNLGINPPSGVLLHGPPGTGKTLIARAVANETGAFFFIINGPEIMSKMSGESEANLRRAFEEAAKNAPAIIFIDEIDSIAPKRDKTSGDVDKRVVSMLLTLMDGVKKRKKVIVLAATNRPGSLDGALRRFGRFDKEIEIGIPNESERLDVLKIHTKKMKLDETVDLAVIANKTHGMVGADLAQLCTEAAYNCVREKMDLIDLESTKLDADLISTMKVSPENFDKALKSVDPSALRETAIESPEVSWEDVGGLEDVKEELKEMVQYPLSYPEIFQAYGQPPSRGCLLWGPPGCGKTMLAKAIATECEANFINIKGPELLTMWVGESEANVREVFNKARAAAPCILFFDEIDSVAQKRGSSSGDSGVGDRVMNAILLEMDGINPTKQVYVVGATNRPELLDPALIRPGRLDSLIYVGLPDKKNREEVFKVCLKKSPLADDINFNELAAITEGYSCADISGLSKVAAKISIRSALETFRALKKTGAEKGEIITSADLFKDGYPPIERDGLLKAIEVTKPSVSEYEIQKYLSQKEKFSSGFVKVEKTEEEQILEDANKTPDVNNK